MIAELREQLRQARDAHVRDQLVKSRAAASICEWCDKALPQLDTLGRSLQRHRRFCSDPCRRRWNDSYGAGR